MQKVLYSVSRQQVLMVYVQHVRHCSTLDVEDTAANETDKNFCYNLVQRDNRPFINEWTRERTISDSDSTREKIKW